MFSIGLKTVLNILIEVQKKNLNIVVSKDSNITMYVH